MDFLEIVSGLCLIFVFVALPIIISGRYEKSKINNLESENFNLKFDNNQLKKSLLQSQNNCKQLKDKDEYIRNSVKVFQNQAEKNIVKDDGSILVMSPIDAILSSNPDNPADMKTSNLTLFPYAAKVVSEAQTASLEFMAKSLEWGNNAQRNKKVASLRELRANTKTQLENFKLAEYQLGYLLELYPALKDVIETDYSELNPNFDYSADFDPVRHFLSSEEWHKLSTVEKNQLALDRYVESRKKSKWQIGRDYELYIGYLYEEKGYTVSYPGSNLGLEDLGRDLIVSKNNKTSIIQCKYWSKEKQIHEKHIMQLYGTVIAYNIENADSPKANGILVTNTNLSETAKKYADILKIKYVEGKDISSFPRIKCNIGKDENGKPTKIYHLPMDDQYDKVRLDKKGEMAVTTVAEAENAGFRRAYKWHSTKED